MDEKVLGVIINKGENPFVEFSKCNTELTDSVFQSICSFLNKDGGTIIVGVHSFGKIVGVADLFLDNILNKFSYAMENEFSPSFKLTPEVIMVNKKPVLYIEIPSSTEVHRFKNKVYDREGCEIIDITYNYDLTGNLYLRKNKRSSENIVCPFLKLSDLEETAFNMMRHTIAAINPKHAWLSMSDEEFLHSEGFWQKDTVSGKEGYVLATVLLFGKEVTIQNFSPITYRVEAIYRNVSYKHYQKPMSEYNENRYDDRDIIFSNLIEVYPRLQKFVQRVLPKRELHDGQTMLNIQEMVFNEVLTNFLVHREYAYKCPARLLVFSDMVITENGSSPVFHDKATFRTLEQQTKNPLISKVFQAMGWSGEFGSGRENILRYAPFYDKLYDIEIQTGEKFVFSISYGGEGLDDFSMLNYAAAKEQSAGKMPRTPIEWVIYETKLSKVCPTLDISYLDKAETVLEACITPLPIQDMMRIVRQSNRTRFRQNILRPLLEEGLLAMRIPTKPSSPLQRYFTTDRGKNLLNSD